MQPFRIEGPCLLKDAIVRIEHQQRHPLDTGRLRRLFENGGPVEMAMRALVDRADGRFDSVRHQAPHLPSQ